MARLEGEGVAPLTETIEAGMPDGWTVPEVKETEDGDGDGKGKTDGDGKGTTDETGKDGEGEKGTEEDGATFMTASAAAIVLGAMLQ